METVADVLFVVIWVAGLALTFVPVVPATWIIWGAALLNAVLTGFTPINWTFLIVLALIALVAVTIDNVAAAWGARKFGGSSAAGWGALVGGLVGLFLGPIGFLIGPFAGAVLAEMLISRREPVDAIKSGLGTLAGMLGGIGAKLVVHAAMGVLVLLRIF
jgi:uncharacterized protein YqgC (DUF456 family)